MVLEYLRNLLDSDFMPHGHCYFWQPDVLWLHTISDGITCLAYYSIPAALFYFARGRRDLKFRWIFVLFGLFILACGTTHLMGVWTTWYPHYRVEGVVKAIMALTSISTAAVLWPLIPKVLALPSPSDLAERSRILQIEVANRREAEAEVRRFNRRLERRVRQRTQELEDTNRWLQAEVAERRAAQERLHKAADELAAANAELESFAYVASHDLRTPLNSIENLAIWLGEDLEEMLTDETREKMDLLLGRVRRMELLLTSLLDYSRAGHLKAEPEVVDVESLVRDTVELLAPPAGFAVEVGDGMPTCDTLKVPLQQVLHNLIDNAFKHHDRPDGRLEITVRDLDGFFELRVADDGPGIPEEFHDKIFEIFKTLKPRDEVEASGMGLAIVKKVVESAGGCVRVDSRPGAGTAFYFTWPKLWSDTEDTGKKTSP